MWRSRLAQQSGASGDLTLSSGESTGGNGGDLALLVGNGDAGTGGLHSASLTSGLSSADSSAGGGMTITAGRGSS